MAPAAVRNACFFQFPLVCCLVLISIFYSFKELPPSKSHKTFPLYSVIVKLPACSHCLCLPLPLLLRLLFFTLSLSLGPSFPDAQIRLSIYIYIYTYICIYIVKIYFRMSVSPVLALFSNCLPNRPNARRPPSLPLFHIQSYSALCALRKVFFITFASNAQTHDPTSRPSACPPMPPTMPLGPFFIIPSRHANRCHLQLLALRH